MDFYNMRQMETNQKEIIKGAPFIKGDGDDMKEVICCGQGCNCHQNRIEIKPKFNLVKWIKSWF